MSCLEELRGTTRAISFMPRTVTIDAGGVPLTCAQIPLTEWQRAVSLLQRYQEHVERSARWLIETAGEPGSETSEEKDAVAAITYLRDWRRRQEGL